MGSDEYASFCGGGLRLKGAKVNKKKKKRDKSAKSHLEKNLGTDLVKKGGDAEDKAKPKPERDNEEEEREEDEAPVDTRTETERRHHEIKRKRVRIHRLSNI